jgi:hypothetical protein
MSLILNPDLNTNETPNSRSNNASNDRTSSTRAQSIAWRGSLGRTAGAVQAASSSPIACNRSTYQVKPFYLSSETVLPIK